MTSSGAAINVTNPVTIDDESWVAYIHDMAKELAGIARDRGLSQLASHLEVAALEAEASAKGTAKEKVKNGCDARRQ